MLFMVAAITVFLAACRKMENITTHGEGTAVSLTADKTAVTATPADANTEVIKFSWTSPNYATDTTNYKFILEIDSVGKNFANKFTKEVIANRSIGLTGAEINNIVLNYGFAIGVAHSLEARIVSSYTNNNEQYKSNTVTFSVTPYTDPSTLTADATSVVGTLATADNQAITLSWTPSFTGYTGMITYTLEYDSATKNFANAKTMAVDAGLSQILKVSQVNAHTMDVGVAGGSIGKIQYRIKATTAQGAVAYSNPVDVTVTTYVPFYNMYLVGSINGWNINAPLEMVSDRGAGRWGKVFYSYIYLSATDEFKIAETVGDWGSAYGNTGGSGGIYTTGFNQGGNFSVPSAGIYRITLDKNAGMVYVQQKQVGVVGGMQGWNPSTPNYGGLLQRDKFIIITNSATTDEFKFHDGPDWDNSTPAKARYWGKTTAPNELVEPGDNLVAPGSVRTRAVWDGTDPQKLKYELSPANEMRVVGNGIDQAGVNDWDPGSSPQMAYQGNGIWTITLTLKAAKEIKFLAGDAWGAFDYEDAGAGAATGERKIKWDGGPNFSTPDAAGTYTITLNEYTGTVTIL